jgi:threonylcarbamoyladenosine tRNA methylthiotransferase MtaB
MIAFVAAEPKMCNHFHIPLQSGCDEVLRHMRRRYNTEFYANLIQRITKMIPECGTGVDVIAGFPGETDEHFQTTLHFIEGLPVSYLHVFTYSERPNTPAAEFTSAVEPRVRFKRNEILRAVGMKKKLEFYRNQIGKTVLVLTESVVEDELRFGFTDNYVWVGLPAESVEPNMVVPVEIVGVKYDKCIGRFVSGKVAA